MALKTRIEPIAKDIEVAINEMLSPESRSKAFAEYARGAIEEADQANQHILGRIPPRKTFVDGREGANLESVNPDRGTIVAEWELLTDVLRWIAATLEERSPIISGAYKRAHTMFADGVEVPKGGVIPEAEEYSFTNLLPYARKIEIGKTKAGRAFVIQVPNRIYERTAQDAKARFGNMAEIFFTYRGIVGGAQIKAGTVGRAHNKSDVRYPTIYLRARRG